jgi:hypothetical protein
MKKMIFLSSAALAALVMTSCSQEDGIDTPDSEEAISFSVFTDRQSRASETNITALQSTGLKVIGYSTGTTPWASFTITDTQQDLFMGSIDASKHYVPMDVTYSSGAWTYSPIKFWPSTGKKLTFFAYNNVGSGTSLLFHAKTEGPLLYVTQSDDVGDQNDLVVTQLIDKTASSNNGQVNFTFRHVLSKIGFKAKTSTDVSSAGITSVVIDSIKVKYKASTINRSGYYHYTNQDNTIGSWTFLNPSTHATPAVNKPLNLSGVSLALDGTTLTQINDDDKFLMLIPQAIAKGTLLIDISYTISIGADSYNVALTDVELEAIGTMAANTQYIYNLSLSSNAVFFDGISVAAWTDGTGANQEL